MPLPKEKLLAVEQFMLNRTLPVLSDGLNIDQIGTGTLFDLDRRLFFVTAGHIFDDIDAQLLALPANPISSALQTIGKHTLYRPQDREIDFAVLELQEPSVVELLRNGWSALSLENVAPCEAEATFVICGYPSGLVRRRGERIAGTLITAYTERFPQTPPKAKEPVESDLDLFFHYDHSAESIGGHQITTPHLRGASGLSIWQYIEPRSDRLWTPEHALKIVGVQASFLEGKYARAKNWTYVLSAFRKIDPAFVIPTIRTQPA